MDKYVVELIGTFFLVLTIGIAAGLGYAGNLAPLAIGGVLMGMIFAGGHVSGAHYNPAVTVAMWLRGTCPTSEIGGYVVAQMLGALLAAVTTSLLPGGEAMAAGTYELAPTLVLEILFTFALCWVILNVATAKGTADNSFYGLAIGITVIGGAYAAGPISGGVFNPAVAVGISIMGLSHWGFIWVYLVATLIGATLAAWAFKTVVKE